MSDTSRGLLSRACIIKADELVGKQKVSCMYFVINLIGFGLDKLGVLSLFDER